MPHGLFHAVDLQREGTMHADDLTDAAKRSGSAQSSRRDLLRLMSYLPLGLAFASSRQSSSALADAAGQPPLQGPGIETQTGQALYSFPRDHAWHGGKFY